MENKAPLHYLLTGLLALSLCGCRHLAEPEEREPVPERTEYSILTETDNAVVLGDLNKTPHISPEVGDRLDRLGGILVPSDYEMDLSGIAEMTPHVEDDGGMDAIFDRLFGDGRPDEIVDVTINFDAATLADVVPAFAAPLGINYILDDASGGSITLSVNDRLELREIWRLFEHILYLSETYCELEGKVLHIRPLSKITREKGIMEEGSNIEARIIPVKYVAASAILAQISRLLTSENSVIALERQNALLVVDSREHIRRLGELISRLDRKPRRGWSQVVIPCVNVPSSQIRDELLKLLPVLGFPASDGVSDADPGAIALSSLDRVQVLVASSVAPEALAELRRWVKVLDRPEASDREGVFLYEVVNGQADQLLQALSIVFPTESAVLSVQSGGEGSAQTSSSTSTSGSGGAFQQRPNDKDKEEFEKTLFDTPVRIFADGVHNRLLIRTTPRAYAMIDAILKRLDTIPTQILMQVLVVEIELNDNNEFGMEFSVMASGDSAESIFDTNFEALQPPKPFDDSNERSGQTGGKIYIFNPDDPKQKFGYIRAIAGRSNLKVLSSPQILATSHSEAKISVGKRVPIITGEITDTSSSVADNTAVRRSYQYEETGIILTVTPQATKGGLISMKIEQVISDAIDNTTRGIDSPIIKEDVLNTTLSLRDGRTLIMGGLIREKQNNVVSSVPIIADIPLLRNIFGNTVQVSERTEILVLVTATIITEETELEANIRQYTEAVNSILRFEQRQYEKYQANQEAGHEPEPENQ